jgi:hypothetical protein
VTLDYAGEACLGYAFIFNQPIVRNMFNWISMFFSYGVYSPQSLHPIYPHKCRFPTCLSFSRLVRLILQRIRHVDISKLEITYLWLFESVIQSSRSYFDQLSLVWPPMPPMDCLHHSISTTTAQIDHVIVRLADLLVSGMTLHTIRNVLLDITRFTYLRVDTVANTVASAHAKALQSRLGHSRTPTFYRRTSFR